MYLLAAHVLNGQSLRQQIDSTNTITYEELVSFSHSHIRVLEKNVQLARSIDYRYGLAKALDNLHVVYGVIGKLEQRAEAALEAIKIYERLNALPELANLYGRFGYQLRRQNFSKAQKYMHRGIKLAEEHHLTVQLCSLYDDYGVFYEEAGQLDSAMYYYKRALKVKTQLGDTIGIPYTLNNLAGIYVLKGHYKNALQYAARSDDYRNKEKGEFGRALNLVLYGEIYNRMGDVQKSVDYFKRCLDKSLALQYKDLIGYSYMKLAELYEKKKDFRSALLNQKKYIAYKDSLLNTSTNARIAELEIAYETEKKDLQIAESKLELRRRNTLLLLTFIVIVALLSMALGIYRFQKLKREKLRKELELENRLKQFELENRLADEKLRIARELHDNIGSHLTFMISSADNLIYGIKESKIKERLMRLSQFGRETMRELRHSIWAMKHEEGDVSELVLKLNEIRQRLQDNGQGLRIEIINNLQTSFTLRSVQMLNLYRVVQEALQNAVKHAAATRVQIIFSEHDGGFDLWICDNGKGFDPQQVTNGNGMLNMKQRCKEAGCTWEVRSSPEGTEIRCQIKKHT